MIRTGAMMLVPVIALLLVAAASASGQQPDGDARDQLQAHAGAASEKVSRHDYQGALEEYQTILRLRPDSAETRANAGMMRHLLGDIGGAVADFEFALRLNPRLGAATLLCGLDLLSLHRPTEAIDYLRRAVQMNPRENRASTGLGKALIGAGRPEEALSRFQSSLRLDSRDTDAAYGAGLAYLTIMRDALEQLRDFGQNSVYTRVLLADAKGTQNRWPEVVRILSEIPDAANPGVPCLSASLGFAFVHAGQPAQAETELHKQQPGNICPLNAIGLSRIAFERGDVPGGLNILEQAWEADPTVVKANVDLLWSGLDDASFARLRGAMDNAAAPVKSDLKVLLTASLDGSRVPDSVLNVSTPNHFAPGAAGPESLCSSGHYTACAAALRPLLASLSSARLLLLAQSAFYSGDPGTTLKAAGRLTKTAPTEPAALFWKAKAAQRLALEEFASMTRSAPDSPHLHFLLAEAYRQQDNPQAARQEYQKVLSVSPDDVPARIGLARVLIALEDPNATVLLKEIIARDPANPEASYLLGELLVTQVRYAEARPLLRTAVAGGEEYAIGAHSLLARIAYEDGAWSEALKELQPCLKFDKRGNYHYRLYQIYKKLGDAPAAAEALRMAKMRVSQEGRP